jgi:hypothetical protein
LFMVLSLLIWRYFSCPFVNKPRRLLTWGTVLFILAPAFGKSVQT